MEKPTSQHPNLEPLSRNQVLIAMGITAVVLLAIAKLWLHLDPLPQPPLRWSAIDLAWGISLGLGIAGASTLLYQLWPRYRTAADWYLQMILKPLLWPDVLWLGLLPGLSEELLFRGVMLPALGLNATGLVLSSLCFGILHMSSVQQWPYVVWATIVGSALGWAVLATGNLLVPVTAHILANVIASVAWKWIYRHQPESPN
ncbi:MAG: CPBP family intramembrane glutamic endopeptidase [Thermosynechococcaceae cyanobacterium]